MAIIFFSFIVISTVNASENVTENIVGVDYKNNEYLEVNSEDTIQSISDSENEKLQSTVGTFNDFETIINNTYEYGSISLNESYIFDSTDNNKITISKSNICIDGKGNSLNGANLKGILTINGNNVTFKNTIFKNSLGTAIIWNGNSGTLINCTFINNYLKVDNSHSSYGGAIYWVGKDGSILNSNFSSNCVKSYGEDYLDENAYSYAYGGAIYLDNTNCKIDGCYFSNNIAYSFLKAKQVRYSDIFPTGGVPIGYANAYGGAIYINSGTGCIISNSTFKSNNVESYVEGTNRYNGKGIARVISQAYGAAVHINTNNCLIDNCKFDSNTAYSDSDCRMETYTTSDYVYSCTALSESKGGAISGMGNYLNITNSIFIDNLVNGTSIAYTVSKGYNEGGAIYVEGTNANIHDLKFINNSIQSKAIGGYEYSRDSTDITCHGGALAVIGSNSKLNSLYFENNAIFGNTAYASEDTKGGYGGALYVKGTNVDEITNSIFKKNAINIVYGGGSAIYAYNEGDGDIIIKNSIILNQTIIGNKNIVYDNNWWGDTNLNYNKVTHGSANKWVFLDMSANNTDLFLGEQALVTIDLSKLYIASSKEVYDYYGFNNIGFNLIAINGTLNNNDVKMTNGKANVIYTATTPYSGSLSLNYNNIEKVIQFNIKKPSAKLNIDVEDVDYGEQAKINVNLFDEATGDLFIYLNNILVSTVDLSISENNLTIDLPNLAAGLHSVRVTYSGDSYYDKESKIKEFSINKIIPDIEINKIIPNPSIYGDEVTFNVNIINNVTGNVNLFIKDNLNVIYNKMLGINELNNISLPILNAGTYVIYANYTGDINYTSNICNETFTINKAESQINLTMNNNTVFDEDNFIEVNTNADGKVTLKIGLFEQTLDVVNKKAIFNTASKISANDNPYNVEIIFIPEDNNYNISTKSAILKVSKAKPIFNINIDDNNYKETTNLEVTFVNDITGLANIILSNDKGFELKIPNVSLSNGIFTQELNNLDASEYLIAFEYGGNNNYNSTTLSKTFRVFKTDPTIGIEVINATYGQTANIIVNTNVEGNVTITVGLEKIYENVLINNNVVIQNINDIDVGTYSVKVTYNGNNNYNVKTVDAKLTIDKASTNVIATVDDISYSQTTVINVKGSVDGIGIVKIDENYVENVNIIANTITPVTIENIAAGKHNVSIQLKPSNKNYDESTYNTEYTVSKKETTVVLDVPSSVYGEDVIVNVTSSEDGKIILKIGDITKEKTVLANTVTKINLGVLAAKTYDIIASFDAGDNYKSSNDENKIVVSPAEAKITEIQSNNNVYGENTIIDVKSNVEGILTVKINNAVKTFNIDANKLTSLDLGKYDANTYDIDLTLDTGANYTQATGSTKVTVNPKQTIVNLDVNNEVYGNNVVVKVTASENGKVIVQVGSIVKTVNVEANKVASVDLGVLDVNSYEVIATFDGGENFNASSDKESFEMSPKASAVTFVDLVNNYIYSNNVVVNVKSDTDGALTVNIGDKTQTKQITADDIVSFDFGILDVNKYDIKVSLDVGNNYIPSQNTTSITIAPKNTVVTLNTKDYDVDENVIVNITASENGKVTLKLNNIVKTVDVIANKISSVDFGILGSGSYDVIANFTAGSNYVDSSDTANIKVLTKIDENDIDITVPEIKPNQENNIVINLPADATGTVTLTIGNNSYTFNVKNGVADIKVPELSDGNYDYKINYSGDSKYSSFEKTDSITVAKPTPEIVVPPLDEPSADGSVAINLPSDATGTVTLVINGKAYSFPVVNGVANVYMPDLSAKIYSYSITYSGDSKYDSFTNVGSITVTKKPVNITASSVTTVYNGGKYIVATLTDKDNNPMSDFDVTITIDGKPSVITTDDNGQAKLSVNGIKPGKYVPTVVFSGNSKYLSATKSLKVTVKKATPKVTAAKKTFKRTLKTKKYTITLKTNQNKVMKNTKVTIKVKGKTYSAKTNSKGKATFKITKLTKKGKFNAVVTYKGNTYYNKVTKKVQITIK